MNTDIKIRKANKDDLAALHQIIQEIAFVERPFDETINDGFVEYYPLESMLTDEQCCIAVAETNNQIVATGLLQIREGKSYHKYKQFGYLGAMYVHPSQRGKGLNQQIVDELKRFALSRGITEFRLEVYPGNMPAIKAYEKAGFAPHLLEMRMHL